MAVVEEALHNMANHINHNAVRLWLRHAALQALVGVLAQIVALLVAGPFWWLLASPVVMALAGGWLALRFARKWPNGVNKPVLLAAHTAGQLIGAGSGFALAQLRDPNAQTLAGTCLAMGLGAALFALAADWLMVRRGRAAAAQAR